ncbi:MAG: PDZ domain-containing protein, partial [Hymenobacteraceae bacterium]|nr:PDZ domain-containing protein [Hymenobacteraceae bacterium]MDX5397051.1 PDZ domain-containing protein [Hymenobacteraceae bacterium]MDX5513122.1 PDZ domain-containing protein [Hymenobacteraceae bacterium]
SPGRSYQGFLGLVAHEYFHLWNVKRLRPEPLGPFNYDAENYTKLLWVSEGFTSFYDDLLVCRAGLMSPDRYMEIVGSSISYVENTAGNKVQTVTESSFDAWIKFYRRNENSANSEVSYYSKGAVIAMLLNLEIIKETKGEKSLDDVMKYMYDRYYKKLDRGFTDAEVKEALEKFTGKKLDTFFEKYVNGTETPDYNAYFAAAGLKLVDTSAENNPALGASVKNNDGKIVVTAVTRNSSAWNGGLNVNDEVIAVNNYRVEDLTKLISTFNVGDEVKFLISRDGIIQELTIKLQPDQNLRYRVEAVENPTEQQQKNFQKWLELQIAK